MLVAACVLATCTASSMLAGPSRVLDCVPKTQPAPRSGKACSAASSLDTGESRSRVAPPLQAQSGSTPGRCSWCTAHVALRQTELLPATPTRRARPPARAPLSPPHPTPGEAHQYIYHLEPQGEADVLVALSGVHAQLSIAGRTGGLATLEVVDHGMLMLSRYAIRRDPGPYTIQGKQMEGKKGGYGARRCGRWCKTPTRAPVILGAGRELRGEVGSSWVKG